MRAFVKAVFVGSLAGSWAPLIFTVMGILSYIPEGFDGSGEIFPAIAFALSPFLIVLCFVLTASVLVGLPTTAILSRLQIESSAAYIIVGIVAGAAFPIAVLEWIGSNGVWSLLLSVLGAFSGGVTGRIWWVEARETCVR